MRTDIEGKKNMNRGGIILGFLFKVTVSIVIMAVLGYFTLDYMVEFGLEIAATNAAGSRVRVSSVDLSLASGKGVINGISVQNPKGFSDGTALAVKSVAFQIDTRSLMKNPVVIDQVTIEEPDIVFENAGSEKSNIAELSSSIDRFLNAAWFRSNKDGRVESGTNRKRFTIRRLSVSRGQIAVRSGKTGRKMKTHRLPSLTLTNLGGENGAESGQLGQEVVSIFSRGIIKTAMGRGFESYLKILVQNRILDKANGFVRRVF